MVYQAADNWTKTVSDILINTKIHRSYLRIITWEIPGPTISILQKKNILKISFKSIQILWSLLNNNITIPLFSGTLTVILIVI